MATYTNNLGLKKPEGIDKVLINDLNENFEKLDQVYGSGAAGNGIHVSGIYSSYAELEMSVINPPIGQTYMVGTYSPYDLYMWTGEAWTFIGLTEGKSAYVWIKYSATMPDSNSDMVDTPNEYIGICSTDKKEAPEDYTEYTWYRFKGDKGDKGDRGNTGVTPYITFTVSTGEPGTQVIVNQSGTAENPAIHLTIPKGNTGAIENLTINGKLTESGTITLTAEDVGALPSGGIAVDADKLGGSTLAQVIAAAGDKAVTTLTGDMLSSMSDADLIALYTGGARLLKVTDRETTVLLMLHEDGTTEWAGGETPENLLVNPDFIVNQRGLNTYSGSAGYAIDMWQRTNSRTTVKVYDGYINVSSTNDGAGGFLRQTFATAFDGVYTLAAMVRSDYGGSLYFSKNGSSIGIDAIRWETTDGEWTLVIGTMDTANGTELPNQFSISVDAGANADIAYCILLEGAYTEKTFPKHEKKNLQDETARCKYYFRRISRNNITPYAGLVTSSSLRLGVNVGTMDLRTVPTVTMSDDFSLIIRLGTGGYSTVAGADGGKPASINAVQYEGNTLAVYFEYGSAIASNNMAVAVSIASGYIDISAEPSADS